MEERIEPARYGQEFKEEDIQTMLLFNMKQFMPEDLFALFGVELDLPVSEQPAEKGIRRAGFIGIHKTDLTDVLNGITANNTADLQ